jgi:hypothetical protein
MVTIISMRDFGRESQGQGQRHRTSQAAPEHYVLLFHRDATRRARKQKAARVDRDRAAQSHQRNRNNRRMPYRREILMGFVHSDQEEHHRVCDEGGVFPKRLHGLSSMIGDRAERLKLPMTSPAVMVANTPDKPK